VHVRVQSVKLFRYNYFYTCTTEYYKSKSVAYKMACIPDQRNMTHYILQESSVWAEEVQQEPSPDVIWRHADAA